MEAAGIFNLLRILNIIKEKQHIGIHDDLISFNTAEEKIMLGRNGKVADIVGDGQQYSSANVQDEVKEEGQGNRNGDFDVPRGNNLPIGC